MSACTFHLNSFFERAIKSSADCYAIPESCEDLWEELGVTAGADNTGLELWPAAAEKGGPPGARPPIYTCLKPSAKMEMCSFL